MTPAESSHRQAQKDAMVPPRSFRPALRCSGLQVPIPGVFWAFCAILGTLFAARFVVLLALPRPFPDHLQSVWLPSAMATERQQGGGAGEHSTPGGSAESSVPAVLLP